MSMLTDVIREDREYGQLIRAIDKEFKAPNTLPLLVTGLCDGAADSLLVSLITDSRKGNEHRAALIVCPDEKECARLCDLLRVNSIRAVFYQARDLTFYNISASHDYEHERLKVLSWLISGGLDAVITTPDVALGYTVPPARLMDTTRFFDYSTVIDIRELSSALVEAG